MSQMLNEDVRKMLGDILLDMQDEVTIKLFVDSLECDTCAQSHQLMQEMVTLSDKLHYELIDVKEDSSAGLQDEVEIYPTFVVLDKDLIDKGVRFHGIPAGHEINSFLAAIIDMSGKPLELDDEIVERIKAIDRPTNIKVFVTLSCPHCPGAVSSAHRIAMLNPNVKAEMIEAQTFTELSNKYHVSSVPKIVINDTIEFVGNQPLSTFLGHIESAN